MRTRRLYVDRESWANLVLAGDPLLDDRLSVFQPGATFDTLQAYVARPMPGGTAGTLFAARAADGAEIGVVEISGDNIFYFVRAAHRGSGHGLEMVAAVCTPVVARWLGLPCLRARIVRGNFASVRIAEQVGFRFTGTVTHGRPGQTYLQYERRFH